MFNKEIYVIYMSILLKQGKIIDCKFLKVYTYLTRKKEFLFFFCCYSIVISLHISVVVCVKVWNIKEEKQLLIEWIVFFSGLVFLGEQV